MPDKLYYAHSRDINKTKEYQTIAEHAMGVSALVEQFSEEWCDNSFAKAVSFLHDIGKYQPSFQRRIRGESISIPHAICGAKEFSAFGIPDAAAYIIAGHHAGLYDRGNECEEAGLIYQLGKSTEDYNAYKNELTIPIPDKDRPVYKEAVSGRGESAWKEYAFWIRMMFSCLTDADYLDTEAFCSENRVDRKIDADFSVCLKKISDKIDSLQKKAVTETELARKALSDQILTHIKENADVFYMNMPTGSGKTLASMRFALERAILNKKKRIIYVIPYTSIIEQNAKVFKEIFGDDVVLEHHCNFDADKYTDESTREKLLHSSENWDAPFIVTTNVQFFESIYSNRSSKLRKLHNIADSIIVFDEVHMLPKGFFQPCLEAIKILTTKYNCEALFLTATMPNFDKWLEAFKCTGMKTYDLIQDTSCFSAFERCRIKNIGFVSEETVLEKALDARNSLIIVNNRKTARELYKKCPIKKYHLSTYMNHFDRDMVIEEVKRSLINGEHFCLISTSLIEAGVDLDFDVVFRELAGLDNLLQAAGRCNRSGKKRFEESITYSFEFESSNKGRQNERYSAKEVFASFEDANSPDAINFYFDKLYDIERSEMQKNDFLYAKPIGLNSDNSRRAARFDLKKIYRNLDEGGITHFNFAGYAESFALIDECSYPLLIINEENRSEVDNILKELKYSSNGRREKRKLQKYIVSLRGYERDLLQSFGVISEESGIEYLSNEKYYDKNIGLLFEDNSDYIYQ